MVYPRPRLVRPARRAAACPGCGRVVALAGHLELIPPHTIPQPPDHTRNPDGTRPTRAGQPCRWAGDPVPGRPDGRLAPDDAAHLAARRTAERAEPARAAG